MDKINENNIYIICQHHKTKCKNKKNVGHLAVENHPKCNAQYVNKCNYNHLFFAHSNVSKLLGQFISFAMCQDKSSKLRRIQGLNFLVLSDQESSQKRDLFHKIS